MATKIICDICGHDVESDGLKGDGEFTLSAPDEDVWIFARLARGAKLHDLCGDCLTNKLWAACEKRRRSANTSTTKPQE